MNYSHELLCVAITTDKVHADLGDGRMNWESEFYVFEAKGQRYCVIGRTSKDSEGNPTGNFEEVPFAELLKWINVFGAESIKPYIDIEKDVEDVAN